MLLMALASKEYLFAVRALGATREVEVLDQGVVGAVARPVGILICIQVTVPWAQVEELAGRQKF